MLFSLISLKKDQEDKAISTSRQLSAVFKDKFYTNPGSNLKALEAALETLKTTVAQQNISVNFVAANLWGSVLYVTKLGETGVVLVRDAQVKKIDFAKVASGTLFDKDLVFLADASFLKNADLTSLGELSTKDDFEESLHTLGEQLKEAPGFAFCLRLSVQEPLEHLQPLLIANLDEQEKISEGSLQRLSRKLSFHWPSFKLNLNFLQNLQFF